MIKCDYCGAFVEAEDLHLCDVCNTEICDNCGFMATNPETGKFESVCNDCEESFKELER